MIEWFREQNFDAKWWWENVTIPATIGTVAGLFALMWLFEVIK